MIESIKLYEGEKADPDDLIRRLDKYGYTRCGKISVCGDYSLRGEVLIIYPITFEYPVRIDLSGGTVRSIKSIDIMSFKTITVHKGVIILPVGVLRKRKVTRRTMELGEQPINSFIDIEPGDHVVHIDYGIAKYRGMQRLRKKGRLKEHFVLEFKGGDKLFIQEKDLHKVQRYVSFHRRAPKLNRLKGKKWHNTKKRASRGAERTAREFLTMQAKREKARGYAYSRDTEWQKKVEDAFPYKETPDQLQATQELKKDMESRRSMDRLLCGDVGYGKTEVALRAAFKAVMDGRQVAFLVPTTILAEQHSNTFRERLKRFPVNIRMLNRFRTEKEQRDILEGLKKGRVDMVIGTHRLLSDDVLFKDLGLLIIDEEQRFGVKQKQKFKKMRVDVDILTLTATPIPRTLYLALMGGKDISMIETPPLERSPVNTSVIEHNDHIIKQAIERELNRDGQVYFVHNRVNSIEKISKKVRGLVPEASVLIGHGQMRSNMLEKNMLRFIRGEADILVCTTIIESGIDIPNANTMIINEADKYGLADLYQLRGRIGRFDREAYAYLVVRDFSTLTTHVQKRLNAIKKYSELGSGPKVAMRDLEMRGAGNILGTQQSGFIDQIGFDLYCRLLKEEIERQSSGNSAVRKGR